jgi:hypothetical protein
MTYDTLDEALKHSFPPSMARLYIYKDSKTDKYSALTDYAHACIFPDDRPDIKLGEVSGHKLYTPHKPPY